MSHAAQYSVQMESEKRSTGYETKWKSHTYTHDGAFKILFSSRTKRNVKIFITDNVYLENPSLPGGVAA